MKKEYVKPVLTLYSIEPIKMLAGSQGNRGGAKEYHGGNFDEWGDHGEGTFGVSEDDVPMTSF